jgi:hypothetical protein
MKAANFTSILKQSIPFISDDWKSKHADLLSDEHWNTIGERLFSFAFENEIRHSTLPIFNEEIAPDYPKHYQYFENLKSIVVKNEDKRPQRIAKSIEEAPLDSLLIILGQRKTPASITDKNAIPPLKEQLLKSCFEPYNEQICKAARAREKHIARNEGNTLWGTIKGTPEEKEQSTKAAVIKIIDKKTWWNVFTHYKHDAVYEIRVASGEGIRWKKNKLELIGFLEPFV